MLSFISDMLFGALPTKVQAAIAIAMLVVVAALIFWALT
jgi:hypothetical protein